MGIWVSYLSTMFCSLSLFPRLRFFTTMVLSIYLTQMDTGFCHLNNTLFSFFFLVGFVWTHHTIRDLSFHSCIGCYRKIASNKSGSGPFAGLFAGIQGWVYWFYGYFLGFFLLFYVVFYAREFGKTEYGGNCC